MYAAPMDLSVTLSPIDVVLINIAFFLVIAMAKSVGVSEFDGELKRSLISLAASRILSTCSLSFFESEEDLSKASFSCRVLSVCIG